MAITTNYFSPALQALFDRFLAGCRNVMTTCIDRQSRRVEIEALEAKTDEELAQIGITRDRIVQYVFSDRFWI